MACVLIVDDDPGVLRVMTLTLRLAGIEPDPFEKPAAALKAFFRHPDSYDLLVTDVMMPGMHGPELAARILEIRPNLPVVFVTGAAAPDLPNADLLSRFPVLSTPAQIPLLKTKITRLLHR